MLSFNFFSFYWRFCKKSIFENCLYRETLANFDLNKNDFIQEVGKLCKNDVYWGQANITVVPPTKQ